MEDNIALVIIFNHRYDNNIRILEEIYGGRFRNIYFLVPFYDGDRENVIPVYGSSYFYEIYIAQGFAFFFKQEYSHYFFLADDMILNPVINESNIIQYLKLKNDCCFIPEIKSMHTIKDLWHTDSAMGFNIKKWGVEAGDQLPSYDEAIIAFNKHNLEIKPLRENQIYKTGFLQRKTKRLLKAFLGKEKFGKKMYDLPYPLVAGFSDILVVSKSAIQKFSHYCGVFGALDLFVELAIPTALVLSTEKITFENNLHLQGKYLISEEELKSLNKYNNDLNTLFNQFPASHLFLHPVKLSRWRNLIAVN